MRLDAQEPGCRCEGGSISDHSPGRVNDGETLVRILVAPTHFDKKTGLPKATALSHAETIGLSVFREQHATNDEIFNTAKKLIENFKSRQTNEKQLKKIGVFGVIRLDCNTIRSFIRSDETEPCYCVYDTALAIAPSHADAFQRIADTADGIPDARRNALFDKVKAGFVPVDQFRDGLLKDLAPVE